MKNKHATHNTYVDIMLGAELNLLLQLSILWLDDKGTSTSSPFQKTFMNNILCAKKLEWRPRAGKRNVGRSPMMD